MSDLLRRRAMMAQSRGKTMQLLAEYTVTEPVREIRIPFTDAMKSCDVLYVMLDITEKDSDWLYVSFGSTDGYYTQSTRASDKFQIIHVNEATVDGVVFPEMIVALTNTNGTPRKKNGATYISFRQYSSSKQIQAGSIKIYGEV